MDKLSTAGKWMYLVPFAIFGLNHFMAADMMSSMVPAWLPGGSLWVYLTGAATLAAVVAVAMNKKAKLALALSGVMLVLYALLVHVPTMMSEDPMMKTMGMVSMMKDIMLAGAAWWAIPRVAD
jgi:uncharacterized membrane protein